MSRIVCVGEGMLELHRSGEQWTLGHAGDTLNVAIHFARLGHESAYLTALGADPLSRQMKQEWQAAGIDCALVLTHPTRNAGLYAIDIDAAGERSFTYWRSESAARALFECDAIEQAERAAANADLLFFSLISLAILRGDGRERLLELARHVRAAGGKVAFDSNYRAALWSSPEEARQWHDRAAALADYGLPGLDDQRALGTGGEPGVIAEYWQGLGCGEVLVKLGEEGCLLPGGSHLRPAEQLVPLDTSGAGDAFDAAYLAARICGASVEDSARAGQALAGWAVMHRGAIPPLGEDSPYRRIAEFGGEAGR